MDLTKAAVARDRRYLPTLSLANTLIVYFHIQHCSVLHLERRPNSLRNSSTFWSSCIASATVLPVSCLSDTLSRRYHYVPPHLQLLRKSCAWRCCQMSLAVSHHEASQGRCSFHTDARRCREAITMNLGTDAAQRKT